MSRKVSACRQAHCTSVGAIHPKRVLCLQARCRDVSRRKFISVIAQATPDTKSKPELPSASPVKGKPAESPLSTPPQPPPPKPPPKDKRPLVAFALDKMLESAEDIGMHVRRALLPLPTRKAIDNLMSGGEGTLRYSSKKPVLLVLGSGWGAHSLIKVIDTDRFDVVVISPRNHFIFTPMLPSTAVGTVEFRSLLEPIRVANPFITYFEAGCDHLDIERKVALCTSNVAYESGRRPQFEVLYDMVVVAVGEQPATFNVPGVEAHCYFMKEINDCVGLRKRIGEAFELAALPGVSEEDQRKALHFVVVGGGPTGVEFAGTLADFVRIDLQQKYPELMQYVRVSLLQSAQSILSQFDSKLQVSALENFKRTGVEVRTGVRVVAVTQDQLLLAGGERIDYGVCVWSTGNSARPLTKQLVAAIPAQQQANSRGNADNVKLAVDPYLRVIGAKDMICLGDASSFVTDRLPTTAQVAAQQGAYVAHLINKGYALGTGGLDAPPPKKLVPKMTFQLAVALATAMLTRKGSKTESGSKDGSTGSSDGGILNVEDLKEDDRVVEYYDRPFEFLSLGIMAYVGNDKAITQVEVGSGELKFEGAFAYLLWRSVYITKQVSFRNRVLILFDWIKAKVFGRDLSVF